MPTHRSTGTTCPVYSLEALPLAAAWVDSGGGVQHCNQLWEGLTGKENQLFAGLLHPEDAALLRAGFEALDQELVESRFVRIADGGRWSYCRLMAQVDRGIGDMGLGSGWLVCLQPCDGEVRRQVALSAQNRALRLAYEVGRELLQEVDTQSILTHTLERLVDGLPVAGAFVPVLDLDGQMALVVEAVGSVAADVRGKHVAADRGLCAELSGTGGARLIKGTMASLADDPLFPHGPPHALVVAPLHYEGRILGGICAIPSGDREQEIRLAVEGITLLARVLSGALETARRFGRVRETSDYQERLLAILPDPLWVVGPDGLVQECNSPTRDLLGRESIGLPAVEVFDGGEGEEICLAIEAARGGDTTKANLKLTLHTPSGSKACLVTVLPMDSPEEESAPRVLVLARDVDELAAIEREREQIRAATQEAARLTAVGELATGMAHEINNPLMGMINYADLAHEELAEGSPVRQWMEVIIEEGERIAKLLRHLRSLGKADPTAAKETVVSAVCESAFTLVRHSLSKEGIDLTTEIPHGLPPVKAVPHQLQQVLVALLSNARWAIGERRVSGDGGLRGSVHVHAKAVEQEGGRWVRLVVEDDGIGIEENDLPRLFDPFFTRRHGRSGLGLGLTHARKDVVGWGGRLSAEAVGERGARFSIWIPAEEGEEVPV